MTEFLDKSAVLNEIKRQISNLETNAAKYAEEKKYWDADDCQKWISPLEHLVDLIESSYFAPPRPGNTGSLLCYASTKELIAELKTRPAVNVKEFLDIREGDTWQATVSGDVPATVIMVAEIWRDRS